MKDKDTNLLKESYEKIILKEYSDQEFLQRIAALWIELGGDSEGVAWSWKDLQQEIARQENM